MPHRAAFNSLRSLGSSPIHSGTAQAIPTTNSEAAFSRRALHVPASVRHVPRSAAYGASRLAGVTNEDKSQGRSGGFILPLGFTGKTRRGGAVTAAVFGPNDATGRSQQSPPPRRKLTSSPTPAGRERGGTDRDGPLVDRAGASVAKSSPSTRSREAKSSKVRAGLVSETAEEGREEGRERREGREGRDEERGEQATEAMEPGATENDLGRPLLSQGLLNKEKRGGRRKAVGGAAPRKALAWRGVLPHVLTSSIIAVVNGPLESMAVELLFAENALAKASVVSVFLLGAFLGCSASSTVADSAGRKKGFQICSVPILIGSILCAMASSLSLVVTGRFLLGFGLGMAIPIMALYIPEPLPPGIWVGHGHPHHGALHSPVSWLFLGFGMGMAILIMALYIAEISPPQQRGTFGAIPQVLTCTGILAALLAAALLPASSWRMCFWIAAVPAALFCMACEFLVDSPRWLAQHGRWTEAEAAVGQLLGEAKVKETMEDLHHSFGGRGSRGHGAGWEEAAKGESKEGKGEQQHAGYTVLEKGKGVAVAGKGEEEGVVEKVTWRSLFSKRYVHVVTIGATLFALQQLSGINAVFFFSSHLFKSAGIHSGALASVAMGTLNLVASLVCSALIDRVGRKALITGSFVGMGLCMAVQAAAQVLPWMTPAAPLITLTATLVYVACFTMGAGPVPGLMLPEMLPNHIRAKGMAFAMCVHWVFNFMVGFSFLPLMVRFGPVTLFSFFACVCFGGALFTSTSLVETAGRSLEEIEEQLLPPA
ncbi:unnamed protein product [Closterium sp. Yama58-4]|nr:unnamed protein product [Closterium sp. Yama58-4]